MSVVLLGACAETQSSKPSNIRAASASEAAELWEVDLRISMGMQARLWNVGQPMLVAGTPLCGGRTRDSFGFWTLTRWDVGSRYQTAAIRIFELDDSLRVVHIARGSPAARAGLVAGDRIEAVGAQKMPLGRDANAALSRALAKADSAAGPVAFSIRRGGERLVIEIEAEPQCDFALIVTERDAVEAVMVDSDLYVSLGMMRLARSDAQLAVVIAHELAHGVLEHRAAEAEKRDAAEAAAVWLAGFLADTKDALTGADAQESRLRAAARPFDARSEVEADYLSLYFLARAGVPLGEANALWRYMAAQPADSLAHGRTHPIDQPRLAAFQPALREIHAKQHLGQPLMPETPPAVVADAE